MADNVSLTPGGAAGALASTEEVTTLNGAAVAAQHLQRLILALRTADATGVDISAANPLPVTDAAGLAAVDTLEALLTADAVTAAVRDRLGEISANPTANTVQDRLKALLAAMDGVEGLLDAQQAGTVAEPMSVGPVSTSRGYAQVASTTTATLLTTLTGGLPAGATKVLLRPSAEIRIRDDATLPTATVGYPIPALTEWQYDGSAIGALKLVNAATVDCWFFS